MFGRQLFIGFTTISLLCCVCPAVPAQTPELPAQLVIGTKETPPFAMKGPDGKWTGISIDLWQDMAKRLKLNSRSRKWTWIICWPG